MFGWIKSCYKWIVARLKDLFYGAGNRHLDAGRILAFFSLAMMVGAEIWNMHLHLPIDLGPTGLGGAMAGILTAAVVYMYKDRQADK